LTLQQTEEAIRNTGHKDIVIVVMGNNPSVSSTPKMPVSEALADRLEGLNVSLTGIHPIAVNYQKYPVLKMPFMGTPDIPFDKLPMEMYRAHNWHCLDGSPRSPYASIYTSMGCPYDCYYCNIHTLYPSRKVQLRPVGSIIKEVDKLVLKYDVCNIKIWDELFALDGKRVVSICSELRHYDLNMWAYARIDTVTKGMLKAMRQGGIRWLAYGFESVTDKKFTSRTEDVIQMTKDAGISIIGNFMFGTPGTTLDDDKRSVEFAKTHLFEFVNLYDAKPYPGSKWYEDTKPVGREFNQYKGISTFRRDAFNDYFTNPEYLAMLDKKWGLQAVMQIREMLEKQL